MKEAVRPFSSKLSILKLLCAFVICIMICTSFTKAEETKETTESQIMSEIDTLYSDLLQIEESIGKSLRKIQLLKRIQTNRIVVPEMGLNPVINVDNNINQATAKSQENVDLNEFSNQNLNEETTIEPTIEEIALSNSFFEKVIVDSNNTDFVKFRFLNTPLFVDKDNDFVTKVIVAIHTDGSMGVYSTNTGKMLNQFNLNQKISEIKDSNILSSNINWENDIVEFLAETYSENLRTSILTTQGNMYIFEFKIEKMDKQAAFDRTLGKPSEMLTIALSTGFNLWQTIISSNSTLYYEEINSLLQEGLIPISLSYFGNFITGNYMIADNKGFFSIIKKDENKEREDKYGFTLFKRSYSGFGYFSKITNQYYLTIFSSFDRFTISFRQSLF